MSEPSRRFGRTLGSLALAFLNATLILVALCLWLGWHLLAEARAVTSGLADRMTLMQPLQTEVLGLRADVAGLRADLAALGSQVDPSAATAALADRVAALDARVSGTADQVNAMFADPGLLVDRAVDRAALQIRSGISACTAGGA